MSKSEKLLARICSAPPPKDVTWDKLCTMLKHVGFNQIPGGKGFKFVHAENDAHIIILHRPHNRNPPTVLPVYIKHIIERLTEWGIYEQHP